MAKLTGTEQAETLTGTAKADELFGLGGNDLLLGLGGNDYLDGGTGRDDLRGGAGNDVYIVDNAGDINKALADPGRDTVGALISYTLGPQQEDLTLLGKSALTGTGNALANHLNGNDAANILIGLGGNDVLDGHKGIDDLRGGAGDDLYFIDDAHEINKSLHDAGTDQVQTTVSYTLGNFQETLVLLGSADLAANGNAGNNFLRGNDGANILHGLNGNDVLDGGRGNDQLFGDAGDDKLYGFAGLDVLHGGRGDDELYGLDGADNLQGDAGNDKILGGRGNDVLLGGDGNDDLRGEQGNDILFGGNGDDILSGGPGVDVLHGGNGNDKYVLYAATDSAAEIDAGADAGIDTVYANFNFALGANQENLSLFGSASINGTGNDGDNLISGNSSANVLHGQLGDDHIDGGGGADTLLGDGGADTLYYEASAVLIDGGASNADTLFVTGAAANVTLDLTTIDDSVVKNIEIVSFALTGDAPGVAHTLVMNASDVLALSDTTDVLQVFGEADDTVRLGGGGWTKDNGTIANFQGYTNGSAHVLVDSHILDANVHLS